MPFRLSFLKQKLPKRGNVYYSPPILRLDTIAGLMPHLNPSNLSFMHYPLHQFLHLPLQLEG